MIHINSIATALLVAVLAVGSAVFAAAVIALTKAGDHNEITQQRKEMQASND